MDWFQLLLDVPHQLPHLLLNRFKEFVWESISQDDLTLILHILLVYLLLLYDVLKLLLFECRLKQLLKLYHIQLLTILLLLHYLLLLGIIVGIEVRLLLVRLLALVWFLRDLGVRLLLLHIFLSRLHLLLLLIWWLLIVMNIADKRIKLRGKSWLCMLLLDRLKCIACSTMLILLFLFLILIIGAWAFLLGIRALFLHKC